MEKWQRDFYLQEIQSINEENDCILAEIQSIKAELASKGSKKELGLDVLSRVKTYWMKNLEHAEGPDKNFCREMLKDIEKEISERSVTEGKEFARVLSKAVKKGLIRLEN